MSLNCIWWWGYRPGSLGNLTYSSMTYTLSSTQNRSVRVHSIDQIVLFSFLLGFITTVDLNHSLVCKLFVFDTNTWWIKLMILDSNTLNHLTVNSRIFNIKCNYLCQILKLETISLCANKWLILNQDYLISWNINIKSQYLKIFNCEKTKEL